MQKIFLFTCLLVTAIYFFWYQDYKNARDDQLARDTYGFLPVAIPDEVPANTVLLYAPINCPSQEAQHAYMLSQELSQKHIPNVLLNSWTITSTDEYAIGPFKSDKLRRLVNLFDKGKIPAVLINGMAKSDPSADDIAAEFKKQTNQ